MKKLLLLFLFLCLSGAVAVWAQVNTAQIVGTITDVQGAALPNAQITVIDPSTGFTRSTISGPTGNYSIPLLPPGTYNLRVQAPKFATLEQKGIALLVGQTLTLNHMLKPGTTNEVVLVTEEPPLISTTSSELGGSVSPTEVESLPILDRNFSGLMMLIPGVRPAEGFDPTKTRVGNISINGGDGRQIDTNVDGGDNKDLVVGGMVQNFTMEGIQEFNVLTERYTAEAGHSVGAVVNVVSKSGTNTLHGSAFSLFQLSTLNRTNYFESLGPPLGSCTDSNVGRCKAVYHRYHFGGSVGGPIIKDKLFFFGAYEQKREPGGLTVSPSTFSELTTFADQTSGFAGGPYAFPVRTLPYPYIDHLATVKVDYKLSDKQNLFFRYGRQKWTNPNDQVGSPTVPFAVDGTQSNSDTNNFHDFTINHNYTISPTKVNSLNLHFQDMANAILASPTNSFTYPIAGAGVATNPNINFSDGSQVGTNVNVPQQTLIRKYQIRDDFNWMHGAHNFKFGGNWIYFAKMGGYFYFGANGYQLFFFNDPNCIQTNTCTWIDPNTNQTVAVNYPNNISTPGAVQEILYSGGSGSTAQPPWHSLGFYAQDDYKITRRLTLNLGVRWDANIDFLRPMLGNSMTDSNRTIWTMQQTLQALGSSLANDPGVQRMRLLAGNTGNLNRTTADWKELQPRLGFAWDVTGTGKHVIRGGYGIARDQLFQNITLFSIQQTQPTIYQTMLDITASAPPGQTCTSSSPTFNLCNFSFNGVNGLPTAPPTPLTDLAFGGVGRIVDPKITDPWSQQMSIGWAYQINPDYAFSVDYRHILGTFEERMLNQNPEIRSLCDPSFPGSNPSDPRCVLGPSTRLMDLAFATADTCAPTATATECGAGRLAQIYDYATNNRSMYDGINFQLRKRMNKHFMFQTSYVLSWSRSWGGFPVASYGGSGLAIPPELQFQSNEFNYTNFDERHRFVFSGVFDLPYGFQISPMFQAASGRPYSFLSGTDIDGDGRVILDRVCVGSSLSAPIETPGCTQLKPNTLTGKPFVQMDMRTSKAFKFGERSRLWLYAEFYNLFNRANFCNSYEQSYSAGVPPNGTFNTPQSFCGGPSNAPFGGVTGYSAAAVPSLHTQFGLRFEF